MACKHLVKLILIADIYMQVVWTFVDPGLFNGFGQIPTTTDMYGQAPTTVSGFGQLPTTTNMYGQAPAAASGFVQLQTTSPRYDQPPTMRSGFNEHLPQTPPAARQAATAASGFGQPQKTSPRYIQPSIMRPGLSRHSPETPPAARPGFGQPPSQKAGPVFGQPPSLTAGHGFGQPPSLTAGPGFGQPPSLAAGPVFGQPPSLTAGPGFGQPQPPLASPGFNQSPPARTQPSFHQPPKAATRPFQPPPLDRIKTKSHSHLCAPVYSAYCGKYNLTHTVSPFKNYLGQTSVADAESTITSVLSQVQNCTIPRAHSEPMACLMYIPQCDSAGKMIPPCSEDCEETIHGCRIYDIPGYEDALGICTIFPSRSSNAPCLTIQQ